MPPDTAPDPRLPLFKPGWMKKAIHLSNGVKKFLQYNSDLMHPEKRDWVLQLQKQHQSALCHRNEEATAGLERELIMACEGSVPGYRSSAIKENIEVIVVAIVVALGIRAYFLQPFKIPTASMQPTLNGITARPLPESDSFPNPLLRGLEYLTRGRNYVEMRVPADWGPVNLVRIRQRSTLHFFTVTDLIFEDPLHREKTLTGYVPTRQMWESLWVGPKPAVSGEGERALLSGVESLDVRVKGREVAAGTLLVRGLIDTGDQVLVNKMAYHFRTPTRGEVFVFSTADIKGIQPPPGIDSQHYIKRLTALPGDRLSLAATEAVVSIPGRAPQPVGALQINGAPAQEAGMRKVMSRENGYRGYTLVNGDFVHGDQPVQLGDKQYMAMGDNSPESSDSRYWGPVPEQNLVGPALFVYWPFLPHFGLIR